MRFCSLCFLSLVVILQTSNFAFTQTTALSVKDWTKKLSDPADKENNWYHDLFPALEKLDSGTVFNFLNQLGSNAEEKGNYFIARFNCIKAEMIYNKNLDPAFAFVKTKEEVRKQIENLLAEAMRKTYECNDDYLTAFVSGIYGMYLNGFGETEAAVMYMMNSADLYEKLNRSGEYQVYVVLGEMLWRVREYEKCVKYTRKAIELLPTLDVKDRNNYTIFCNNTMALAFHRMEQYDSAFAYYKRGLTAAEKINNKVWVGIISGNMAQVYFVQGKYTTSLPLFEMDYTISNANGIYDNAANSLQWAARTNLALGKTDSALKQVREAFSLLQKWPSPNYLQNAYFTAAEIFKTLKNNDSSFYYSGLYNKLHDSLERVIYQSSISISKLRLDDEKNRYSILNLQHEKQAQVQQRNLVIAAILFLAAVALLVINRQRLKLKYRQQLLEQDKLRIEQEMESARAQLVMFTQNILEKTNLIEQLEQQIYNKTASVESQQLITELANQTILTEEDWIRFKTLFEKIYPGFFLKLKETVSDITTAEQRMAALTRLHFSTKQIASILGISPDSVHKTRQRLRNRLNLTTSANLEEFLAVL